ncbi:MAG: trypsin-like peptidase domain-containing protein [Clostridia bacterium]|nr:trypsin-like peptidase domain-containing protein [Clostridia bacterium]
MDNKKFNIFALSMIVVMAVFTIYTGINKSNAKDGRDGLSAYELAVENGEFSGSEYEYLKSLHGKNGSNVTIEDVYKAYLDENNLTTADMTLSEFIMQIYPDNILDVDETATAVELSTASALRSTVDICYSFCLDKPILYVTDAVLTGGGEAYQIITDQNYYNKYASIGVSAGSGVIYKIEGMETPDESDDVAYIITNYHVVYASNYVSDEDNYRVYNKLTIDYFGNILSETMFTATYDDADVKTTGNAKYIEKVDAVEAPIETHFLDSYGIYLYGYQSAEYELSASFVGGSADNDIAVLKVERNKSPNNAKLFEGDYKAVDLGDSKDLDEGETVIAVGNPLLVDTSNVNDRGSAETYVNSLKDSYVKALCLTSTSGDVSAISEYTKFQSLLDPTKSVDMRLIRVSSAINAGNSGGGLYDAGGRLVGIVNGKIVSEEYDNVGFAIPINIASRLADKIIADCDGAQTRISALQATTASLGFTVENGQSDYHYDSNSGSWVRKRNVVVKESSASAVSLGIETGKIISAISFNDEQTSYNLLEFYDLNNILLMASKTETTKVVLHIQEADSSITKITINLTDSMFKEII